MTKKINILYLSYDGMTDPLGQSQVISYISKIKSDQIGYDILSFEKPEVYIKHKDLISRKLKELDITWHPLEYHKKPPIVSTLIDIRAAWKKILEIQKTKKIDIVHCRGYIITMLGLKMKNKWGTKMIFDMRGWWPDEKKESGNWGNPIFKPVYNHYKKLEKRYFTESDMNVSLTFAGKNEMVNNYGINPDKIGVVPTCVNFEVFKEYTDKNRNWIRNEHNIPLDAKVMLYSGSLGSNYPVSDLISTFEGFREVFPNSRLLILTHTDLEYIKSEIHSEKILSQTVITSTDYRSVHKYIHASDIGVIIYKDSFSLIGRSPTKLGEYWSGGVPLIAYRKTGDLELILNEFPSGGYLTDSYDKETIKNICEKIDFDKIDKSQMRQNAIDYYSLEKGIEFYKNLIDQTIKL